MTSLDPAEKPDEFYHEMERQAEARALESRFGVIPSEPSKLRSELENLIARLEESGARFENHGGAIALLNDERMTTALNDTLGRWWQPIEDYLLQETEMTERGEFPVAIAWRYRSLEPYPPAQLTGIEALVYFINNPRDLAWNCPYCGQLHFSENPENYAGRKYVYVSCGSGNLCVVPRIAGVLCESPPDPAEPPIIPAEEPTPTDAPADVASTGCPLIDPTGFEGLPVPERRWILPDMIPLGSVSMLGGAGGVGKSLLAMQLATSCATGRPFLGCEVTRCRVLGFHCEDDVDELHRRQEAINHEYKIEFAALGDLRWASRVADENVFMTFGFDGLGQSTALYEALRAAVVEFEVGLVIIDGLADVFAGNENDRGQARQFVSLLARLSRDTGATVVLLAHPSLTGMSSGSGLSGSTAWNNSVRSRLYLDRPKTDEGAIVDDGIRLLTMKKSNYGPADIEIRIRWQDGVFVALDEPTGIDRTISKRRDERKFLAGLAQLTAEGRTASPSPNAATYAPKVIARLPVADGLTRRQLEAAMERLFSAGVIRVETSGRPSRPQTRIVLVVAPED